MAFCGGGKDPESKKSKEIERMLRADRDKVLNAVKLLLLGAGESGKSTIAKQMKIINLSGFSDDERRSFRDVIQGNVIDSMSQLVKQAARFGYNIKPELASAAERFEGYIVDFTPYINEETGRQVAALWRDPAIQQTYERKSEYQLPGSVDYIMQHAERLLVPGVAMTNDDCLRCRMRTTGIAELDFQIDGTHFNMVDVGGQRSERRKWINCFAGVTAVIFCVALNEYDEKLFEDSAVNRMMEALNLFREVCNHKHFNSPDSPTSMILFLNKSDLFREKIRKVPLTTLFPNFNGGADFEAGAAFIKGEFSAQSADKKKLIFSHVTCATDTENVKVVFNAVRLSILQRSLSDARMM